VSGVTPRSIAAFALVTLIWGSTWLVIKDQISLVPPAWTVTWRFGLAALGMIALVLARRETMRLELGGMLVAAMFGVMQFAVNFQLVYRAEHFLTSGLVAVLFALLLVPNTLLGWLFLGKPVTRRFLAGSAVALGGIALLFGHEYRAAPAGGSVLVGVVLTLAAVCSASIGNVMQASEAARRQPVLALIAWAMVFGALGNALFAFAIDGWPVFDPRPAYVAGLVYLALIGSVVTFPLYFALIRDWGPGPAAYNGVAVPVVAMALSTLFEGYRWSALAAGGVVLAIAGLLIALSGRKAGA
jgi:drug/metabolite transporter (DMT)-like permease